RKVALERHRPKAEHVLASNISFCRGKFHVLHTPATDDMSDGFVDAIALIGPQTRCRRQIKITTCRFLRRWMIQPRAMALNPFELALGISRKGELDFFR